MTNARVITVTVTDPQGEIAPAWFVTAENGENTLFSGKDGAERATSYARKHYSNINFVVSAEMGNLGLFGKTLGKEAA
jgi:hypothetical protein